MTVCEGLWMLIGKTYLDLHPANINLTWLAFKDLLLDGVKKFVPENKGPS